MSRYKVRPILPVRYELEEYEYETWTDRHPVERDELARCEQIDRSIAEAAWIERVILGRL